MKTFKQIKIMMPDYIYIYIYIYLCTLLIWSLFKSSMFEAGCKTVFFYASNLAVC